MLNSRNRRIPLRIVASVGVAIGILVPPSRAAIIDSAFTGNVGSWNTAANWTPLGVPSNGADQYRVFIDNGAAGSSSVFLDTSVQINALTIDTGDSLHVGNGQLLALAVGPIANSGTLFIDATIGAGNNTDLRMDADISLTGGGTVQMTDTGTNRIRSDNGAFRLTNVNNTIRGSGQIGTDSMALTNHGVIQADQSSPLHIDPSPTGAINTGTLQALNGGTLNLSNGAFDNTNGTILAQNNSAVAINSSLVTSGILTTSGSGTVRVQNSTLASPTNTGQLVIPNGLLGAMTGTVTNNATIAIDATIGAGNNTDLRIDTDVTLTGSGTVTMTNTGTNRIRSDNGALRLTNANNTIRGSGQIGTDTMALTNQGIIQADQLTPLTIDPSTIGAINTGTLRAITGGTLNLTSGGFTNTGGTIEAQTGSAVAINSSLVTGGTLTSSGTGTVRVHNSSLADTTNTGQLVVPNSFIAVLTGSMTNNATIAIDATVGAGNNTDLRMDSDVTLTGGGTVTMTNTGTNRIRSDNSVLRLTNVNNTIRGSGQIGTDSMALTNLALIQADQTTPLTIDPSATGAINTGTLRATNSASLRLVNGVFNNAGGVIEAQTGSNVTLNTSQINGGTLTTSGTGVIRGENATLATLTNTGLVLVPNSHITALTGTMTNNATIAIDATIAAGNNTDLRMDSDVTLTGGGTVSMTDTGTNRVRSDNSLFRLTNVNNTIRGSGQIGTDSMALTNQAVIQADQSTQLIIDPSASGAINTGTLRATNNATLNLFSGEFTNIGGIIEAQAGSAVSVNSSLIDGGLIATAPTGVIQGHNSTLRNVTNTGNVRVNNGNLIALQGTMTNHGSIAIDATIGAGNNTDLRMDTHVDLFGGGMVTMTNTSTNRIYSNDPNVRLTNYGNTIQGSGQIGVNQMAFTNWGTIDANTSTGLIIDVSDLTTFDNRGHMNVTGAGILTIAPGGFTTSGYVTIDATRQLVRSGVYAQSDGITLVNGTLSPNAGTNLGGGLLKGNGTLFFGLTNTGGTVLPGSSPGAMAVSGGYSQATGGTLSVELGGLTPVTQHDVLNVTGAAALAGSLRVDAINGFVPTLGQTFVILNATTLTGVFSNIQAFGFPPGLTVQAIYNPTNVTLQVITGLGARLGDMNCDNTVSVPDVPLFIEAVLDPASFDGNHPGCSVLRADMNSDGFVNGRDVAVFTRCVTGGPCP